MLAPECRDIGIVAENADVIIEGEVIKTKVSEAKKGQISTLVDVKVFRYVKGEGKGVVTLKVPGGCLDGMCMEASGTPRFQVGQKGFLCLKNPQNNEYDLNRFFSPVCGRGMLEKLPE